MYCDSVPHGLVGGSIRSAGGNAGSCPTSRDTYLVADYSVAAPVRPHPRVAALIPRSVGDPAVCDVNIASPTALLSDYHSYIRYFDRVLHGDKPSLLSKRLQRIIVNTIPNLCEQGEQVSSHGCSVELQLLQNGRLLWCSTPQTGTPARFLLSDGCMSFPADLQLTADVVLRCSHMRTASDVDKLSPDAAASMSVSTGGGAGEADRPSDQAATRSGDRDEHLASDAMNGVGKFDRVPMWRTAFNVGYVQAGLLVSDPYPPLALGVQLVDRSAGTLVAAAYS